MITIKSFLGNIELTRPDGSVLLDLREPLREAGHSTLAGVIISERGIKEGIGVEEQLAVDACHSAGSEAPTSISGPTPTRVRDKGVTLWLRDFISPPGAVPLSCLPRLDARLTIFSRARSLPSRCRAMIDAFLKPTGFGTRDALASRIPRYRFYTYRNSPGEFRVSTRR